MSATAPVLLSADALRQLEAAPPEPARVRLRRRLDARRLWTIEVDLTHLGLDDATLHADLAEGFERDRG